LARLTGLRCRTSERCYTRLIEGLEALPGAHIFGITDRARFGERCATISFRIGEHNPTEIAAFLGERGLFTWDGNFYALNWSERLGVEQKAASCVWDCSLNTAEEVDRLLAALKEFSADSKKEIQLPIILRAV